MTAVKDNLVIKISDSFKKWHIKEEQHREEYEIKIHYTTPLTPRCKGQQLRNLIPVK
jgi:hypothetical protein